MLTRIYIDNFRCLTNFDWRPGRINLLVGDNGSGKSSVFDVLSIIHGTVREGAKVDILLPVIERCAWDRRVEQRFELDIHHSGCSFRYRLLLTASGPSDTLRIAEEVLERDDIGVIFEERYGRVQARMNGSLAPVPWPSAGRQSFLSQLEEVFWEPGAAFFRALDGLRRYDLEPAMIESFTSTEASRLDRRGQDFVGWYWRNASEHADLVPELVSALKGVIPGFQAIKIRGERSKTLTIRIANEGETAYELLFSQLSDGQRQLVILYSILFFEVGFGRIFLLDEPSSRVALHEIQPWLVALLDRLAAEDQVFVSSHNPEVIDYLAPDSPWRFWRPRGGPVRVEPFLVNRETGLAASQVLARGLLDEP